MKNKLKIDDNLSVQWKDDGKNDYLGEVVTALGSPETDWDFDNEEGKLTVDVAQTENAIIAVAPMAGVESDKIEVYVHNDLLTIRGERRTPLTDCQALYYHQECFWGKFSRTIVLPVNVNGDLAFAEYKNGVLKIEIPKKKKDSKIPVVIFDD